MFDTHTKLFALLRKGCLLCLIAAICSCSKETVITSDSVESYILFGVEDIVQTKVEYDEQENGGLSAKFKIDDAIGVYAFYNYFYYYYTEYASFAESVIFANQGLYITSVDPIVASYSPLKSWTFSTLYGTAPHTLDCVAYYPFKEDYNPDYVNVVHTYANENNEGDGAATLEYYYSVNGVVNSNIDFMTAHKRYDYSGSTTSSDDFRDAMLGLDYIPLKFTRQLASLNLQVTKPEDYDDNITVTGITVYFDAYKKFTQTIDSDSKVEWSDMSEGYSLEASVTGLNVELEKTDWDSMSDDVEGLLSYNEVGNLLEDDKMLFFPRDTEINKIVFAFKIGDDTEAEYTWHPHIATFVANTHYTLNLELNPARAN